MNRVFVFFLCFLNLRAFSDSIWTGCVSVGSVSDSEVDVFDSVKSSNGVALVLLIMRWLSDGLNSGLEAFGQFLRWPGKKRCPQPNLHKPLSLDPLEFAGLVFAAFSAIKRLAAWHSCVVWKQVP